MSVDNNIISENFDKIMSTDIKDIKNKDIPYTTNISDLKKNIICNNNKCEIINETIKEQIKKPIKKSIKKPIKKLIKKPIKKIEIKQNPLYDISKKSLLGSFLYLVLSLPILLNALNKILPNSQDNIYKGLLLRSIIFSILFVLLAKYI